jgi:hypothetical protein
MDAAAAQARIVAANPHACPGDGAIMDAELLAAVRAAWANAPPFPG